MREFRDPRVYTFSRKVFIGYDGVSSPDPNRPTNKGWMDQTSDERRIEDEIWEEIEKINRVSIIKRLEIDEIMIQEDLLNVTGHYIFDDSMSNQLLDFKAFYDPNNIIKVFSDFYPFNVSRRDGGKIYNWEGEKDDRINAFMAQYALVCLLQIRPDILSMSHNLKGYTAMESVFLDLLENRTI